MSADTCGHSDAGKYYSREERRSRRKREVRASTISVKRMGKRELELGRMLYPEEDHGKPKTRGECEGGPRPCPYVSCRWNLYLDVSPTTGAIKLNFPDLEPEQMPPTGSCALDIADRGGATLEEVGAITNLTRERIRQLETLAMARVKAARSDLKDFAEPGPVGVRRLPVIQPSDDDVDDDECFLNSDEEP